MSIKDLFGKKSNKILTKQKLDQLTDEVESHDYILSESISRNEFIPKVDFSKPENFAKYGLAELYYTDSIKSIYNTYPYDGSATEKKKWTNEASYIDRYVFDNKHPRTTGYVKLNPGLGVSSTILTGGARYAEITTKQSITFFGGPNRDPSVTVGDAEELSKQYPAKGGNANIYNTSDNRESNIELGGAAGNTVEFYCKVGDTTNLTVNNHTICLLDIWNGEPIGGANYARFLLEYDNANGFLLTYYSGAAAGFERQSIAVTTGVNTAWRHFAISAIDSGADCIIKVYLDGELDSTTTVVGGAVGTVQQKNLEASIGAYLQSPTSALAGAGVIAGFGGYTDLYMDEFRFWKAKRTSKDIGRHWFTQVDGGVNTDDSNTDLGVYYKFNEGIINSTVIDSTDATVLDYSGRISNGTIQNYIIGTRSTGSAIDEHTTTTHDNVEFKDPIIYSTHPSVVSVVDELTLIGREHDYNNNNSLYRSLPAWILEEDSEGNTLKNLTQTLASYFDKLYLQVEALPRIKDVEYSSFQEGNKPYAFAKDLLESTGFLAPELFVDSSIIEELASRSEDETFDNRMHVIKNLIYQNIYNNIVYIYKSKGTEKSLRNLIRCFGVDEELIKINLYADGAKNKIQSNVRHTAIKQKYVDFNEESRHSGSVYQFQDPSDLVNTRSYLLSHASNVDYVGTTLQAEVVFPKDLGADHPQSIYRRTFLTSSLFGLHEADTGVAQDVLTIPGTDYGNFQVYAIRSSSHSKDAKFQLSSDGFGGGFTLTSNTYKDVYDGEKWNFAVRFRVLNKDNEITDRAGGSTTTPTYVLEFYGVNTTQNTLENEFTLTQTVALSDAQNAARAAKRVYCGAHKTNFTGSVLSMSDVKISSVRYWWDYLDDDTIKNHAYDISNYGRLNPDRPAYFGATSFDASDRIQVPEQETLALHWTFDNVTGSDGSGQFITEDLSSGSADEATTNQTYGWFSELKSYRHTGRGDDFPASNNFVIDTDYISTAKQTNPENINSSDMVNILTQDDETYTRDTRPLNYFFSVEKSMYQAISDEALNIFSGITRFNELLGDPANRYRMTYKNLEKLRQLFFERQVKDVATLEKYVDYYKWLDSSISMMIEQLFPASANFSEELRTVIESHILERNKYHNKMPTLEMPSQDPEGTARGIRELTYDWEHGHAPVDPATLHNEHCLWHNERVERDDSRATSGTAAVDTDRGSIKDSAVRDTNGITSLKKYDGTNWIVTGKRHYDIVTSQSYEGRTYATRRLAKPYKLEIDKTQEIRGGINYSDSKKDILNKFRSSTKITAAAQGVEIQTSSQPDKPCIDGIIDSKFKNATSVTVTDASTGGYENAVKGELMLPFNYHSSGPNTDALGAIPAELNRTNLHSDSYGELNEIPAQGPFTHQWVGGNQHRHVTLTTTQQDTARPELYLENANILRHPHDISTTNYAARYTRDGLAKRPLNISNIKTVAGATEDSDSNELAQGNYTEEYQVVQASNQNRWFVKNEGAKSYASDSSSTYVTDMTNTGISFPLIDFTLPDRTTDLASNSFGNSKHVIIERFSAPGSPSGMSRGSLDTESERYSPYNTVNYRNLPERNHLSHWQSDHALQFGYRDSFIHSSPAGTDIASWHKNNRNTAYNADTVKRDNFYVGHQLPRSDWQYGWINASVPQIETTRFTFISDTKGDYADATKYIDIYFSTGANDYYRLWFNDGVAVAPAAPPLGGAYLVAVDLTPATVDEASEFASALVLAVNAIAGTPFTSSIVFGSPKSVDVGVLEKSARTLNNTVQNVIATTILTTKTITDGFGFASEYTNAMLDVSSSFAMSGTISYTGGTTKDITFAGLNTVIYDPISLNDGTLGFDCGVCVGGGYYTGSHYLLSTGSTDPDLNAILLTRNGPYGYPSWKQVRTGERKYVKAMRKHNVLSVQDEPKKRETITASGRRLVYKDSRSDTFTNYFEPPAAYNKPMFTSFVNAESDRSISVKHSYSNNLEAFANEGLNNRLGIIKEGGDQVYDKLLNMYSSGVDSETDISLTSFSYREVIYPKRSNTLLKQSRQRNRYDESASKIKRNSSGYFGVGDETNQHIRTFWKNTTASRERPLYSVNALGYSYSPRYFEIHKQVDSIWALDDTIEYVTESDTVFRHTLGDLGHVGTARYDEYISSYNKSISHIKSVVLPTGSRSDDDESTAGSPTVVLASDVAIAATEVVVGSSSYESSYADSSPITRTKETPSLTGGTTPSAYGKIVTSTIASITTSKPKKGSRGDLTSYGLSGGSTGASATTGTTPTGSGTPSGGGASAAAPGLPFDEERFSPVDDRMEPVVLDSRVPVPVPDRFAPTPKAALIPEIEPPRPALQWLYNPFNKDYPEKGWSWRASDISSNNPWYNSYEEYSEDVRLMGQNYGTISEFRISQHMEHYARKSSGFNFRKSNFNFLTLDGANVDTDTSGDISGVLQKEFSRRGQGLFSGSAYPLITDTTTQKYGLMRNNAYIPELYEDYNLKNQFYASGTMNIENSRNITPLQEKVSSSRKNAYDQYSSYTNGMTARNDSWHNIMPYNGLRSAALEFNLSCDKDDYIYSIIDKFGDTPAGGVNDGISYDTATGGDHGDTFTLSFWANPDKSAYDSVEYMGSISMLHSLSSDALTTSVTDEIGIWLKCPTYSGVGTLFSGDATKEGIGGLTFYMKDNASTAMTPNTAVAGDIVYHFMSYNSDTDTLTPVVLDTTIFNHIVLQFIPKTTSGTTKPAAVMMWLNGERLYGIHPTHIQSGTNKAYSAVEIGLDGVGTDVTTQFDKSDVVIVGKNMVGTTREDKFAGFIDELSLFRGVLTTDSISTLYGKNTDGTGGGQPTNVLEEFYNYSLTTIYNVAASQLSHYGSTAPKTVAGVAQSDYPILIPSNGGNTMFPELAIWWRMGVPYNEFISEQTNKFDSKFFNRHSDTEHIRHLDMVIKDHSQGSEKKRKRINISANAIKKLIPYNGFYPSQRTVQIGHLFKEDYFDGIKKGILDGDAFHDTQRLQAMLQCFMAPGILYNTLKSGLAVDWPAFNNETGYEPPNYLAKYGTYTDIRLSEIGDEDRLYSAPAPNWYHTRPNPYATATGSITAIQDNTGSFFSEQPRFKSSSSIGPDDAGFVILQTPNLRIPFEGLLAPESSLPQGDNLEASRLSNNKIFTSIILDFDGFDCEGNDISLISVKEDNLGRPVETSITVPIRRDSVIDSSGDFATADFDASDVPGGAPPSHSLVSRQAAFNFCEKVNIKFAAGESGFIALPVTFEDKGDLAGRAATVFTFTYVYSALEKSDSLRNVIDFSKIGYDTTGNYRVALYYVGVPVVESGFSGIDDAIKHLQSPPISTLLFSELARVEIKQTFGSLTGAETNELFKDSSGTLRLYSTLTTIGVKTVKENGVTDAETDSLNGIPIQERFVTGGVAASSIFSAGRPNEIFFMAPEYYTGSLSNVLYSKRYPSFNLSKGSKTSLYKSAIHNFLSEIPNFFLEGQKLTSFTSAPESEFKEMEAGKTYYMDVSCYKLGDLNTVVSPNNKSLTTSSDSTMGRYFGPAFRYKDADKYNSAGELVADPAQAPYTPPYFYGKAVARIRFTAEESRRYTLDEILSGISILYFNEEARKRFNSVVSEQRDRAASSEDLITPLNDGSSNLEGCEESPAYIAQMRLNSSINLKSKTLLRDIEYSAQNTSEEGLFTPSTAGSGAHAWTISTKFESPILNFNNPNNMSKVKQVTDDAREGEGIGMWSGYGELPKENEGVFLEINDSFASQTGRGSLLEVCGFNRDKQRVGSVAKEKKISESIVMIPFVDEKIEGQTITVDGKELFLIDKKTYNSQKENVRLGKPAVPAGTSTDFRNTVDIEETSISNMIKMMDKYYIPPSYNFSEYDSVDPFVMYFLEFEHTLSQEDLVDIWQGVMPDISQKAEKDRVGLSHDLTSVDLFGGQKLPKNMRWMCFRVKEKGNMNFNSSIQDERFKFDFNVGERQQAYSYNWPYDFFSLIELGQIEAGIEILSDDTYDPETSTKFGVLSGDRLEKIINPAFSGASKSKDVISDKKSKNKKRKKKNKLFGKDGE